MEIWYLVADGARARLFQTSQLDGELEETDVYVNEYGRVQNRDLDRDRPGRIAKGGERRASMEDDDGPREHEEKRFAKRLAEQLNAAFKRRDFERLGIIAAPKALGRIKGELNDEVLDALVGTSSKNLTRSSRDDIREHIGDRLL